MLVAGSFMHDVEIPCCRPVLLLSVCCGNLAWLVGCLDPPRPCGSLNLVPAIPRTTVASWPNLLPGWICGSRLLLVFFSALFICADGLEALKMSSVLLRGADHSCGGLLLITCGLVPCYVVLLEHGQLKGAFLQLIMEMLLDYFGALAVYWLPPDEVLLILIDLLNLVLFGLNCILRPVIAGSQAKGGTWSCSEVTPGVGGCAASVEANRLNAGSILFEPLLWLDRFWISNSAGLQVLDLANLLNGLLSSADFGMPACSALKLGSVALQVNCPRRCSRCTASCTFTVDDLAVAMFGTALDCSVELLSCFLLLLVLAEDIPC
ncbi:hypothetical protein Nepgr_020386 [Nepenthes gracilis]|uniref:Uncharacterized protein n=1 Tax=Nepenthes gracilis TaxID=150966 RepID=A0AAD3SV87_NEPGR|nr:hypothetical protein Nepgr_020386 [Nepenthes gracilis]